MSEWEKPLEPASRISVSIDTQARLSVAISLKRIADSLDGTDNYGLVQLLRQMEADKYR